MEEKINNLMKRLEISEEEARQVIEYDTKVDKGIIKDEDLTDEQKKVIKKYRNVARGVNAYGKETKRELKADEPKRYIIDLLASALISDENINAVEVTNVQKNITFQIGEDTFEIDLKRKRKK